MTELIDQDAAAIAAAMRMGKPSAAQPVEPALG
jgi:hypothetical protein